MARFVSSAPILSEILEQRPEQFRDDDLCRVRLRQLANLRRRLIVSCAGLATASSAWTPSSCFVICRPQSR